MIATTMTWALVAVVALTAASPQPRRGIDTTLGNDHRSYEVASWELEQHVRAAAVITPGERLIEYARAPYCREAAGIWVMGNEDGTCARGADTAGTSVRCEEGDIRVMPLWARERPDVSSPWGEWDAVDAGGCGVDLLPVMTQEDFQRLPLPAPVLNLQPDRGWVLVNIATIVYTDPTPVTLRADLQGLGVNVVATPVRWTYDFGDGHTLTTESPGHQYPDHDVFHEYEQPTIGATVRLTTEWAGRYQVDGSPVWRDVDGVAVTTATSAPFDIEERTSRLVSGLCTDRPKPPDC